MGWFSGLGGSFVAGVARGLEGGLEKSRELQEEQILRQQGRMETEGLALLRERRKKTQDLTARLDELSTFGITGNTAAAVLRLSPERYQEFIKRADAATRQADRFGAQPSPELEAATASELFGAGVDVVEPPITIEDQMGQLGITYTGGVREQQPSREKIIQGIMGAFPSTVTSSKEEFDLQASLNRHLGMADTAGIARNQASKVLGLSANDLDTLITGDYKYTDAPEHVRIKMIQTEAEKLAEENIKLTIDKLKVDIIVAQDKVKDIKLRDKPNDKDVNIPNYGTDGSMGWHTIKKGSMTNREVALDLQEALVTSQVVKNSYNSNMTMARADMAKLRSFAAEGLAANLKSFLVEKSKKDFSLEYNRTDGNYRLNTRDSLANADTQGWLADVKNLQTKAWGQSWIRKKGNWPDLTTDVRNFAPTAINHGAVQWIRKKHPTLSDEDIRVKLLDKAMQSDILKTFHSTAVSDYVVKFFKKDDADRQTMDDQVSMLTNTMVRSNMATDISTVISDDDDADRDPEVLDIGQPQLAKTPVVQTLAQRLGDPTTGVKPFAGGTDDKDKRAFWLTRLGEEGFKTPAINAFLGKLKALEGQLRKSGKVTDRRRIKAGVGIHLSPKFVIDNLNLLGQPTDAGAAVGTVETPPEKRGLGARDSEEQALLRAALDRAEDTGKTDEEKGLVARPTDDQLEEKEQVDEVFDLSYKELDTLVDTVDFTGLNAFDAKQKIRGAIRPIVFKMDPDFTNKPFYGAIKDREYALKTITEELYEHLIYLQQKKLEGATKIEGKGGLGANRLDPNLDLVLKKQERQRRMVTSLSDSTFNHLLREDKPWKEFLRKSEEDEAIDLIMKEVVNPEIDASEAGSIADRRQIAQELYDKYIKLQ